MELPKPRALDETTQSLPPPEQADDFLDEYFQPIWQKLARSTYSRYPGISWATAEDISAETFSKFVEYFDLNTLVGLPVHDRLRRVEAYLRAIRRGVAAGYFAQHNDEVPLTDQMIETIIGASTEELSEDDEELETTPVPAPLSKIRKALNQLDRWDKALVLLKAEGLQFAEIQTNFRARRHHVEIGTLRQRYLRALNQIKRYTRPGA